MEVHIYSVNGNTKRPKRKRKTASILKILHILLKNRPRVQERALLGLRIYL